MTKKQTSNSNQQDIKIKNVSYQYPGARQKALSGIDLEINKGEIVLLTGASGAGKTTLVSTLNGMVPQSYGGEFTGKATIKDRDNTKTPIGRLAFIAGMLFQDPSGQLISPTIEDEVAFGPENKGLSVKEINKLIDKYLKYVNMTEYRERPPHALSGGQQQSVAIAAVLAMEPEIYVLDEPTSNLDPLGSQLVFDLIERVVKDQNKTAVIVEHKLEKLVNVVDRMIVMHDGKIVADGKPREVLSKYKMLQDVGVLPPQVTELVELLQQNGYIKEDTIPLTISQAADLIRPYLKKKRTDKSLQIKKNNLDKETIVKIKDLEFSYPDGTKALNGVSLDIYRGEFLSIVGQNGSAKTTLVKHLNGLLRPTSGSIYISGENIASQPVSTLATKVGYCFQNPDHQIFSSRVYDELAFGLKNMKKTESEADKIIHEVAESLGIQDLLEENPHTLSKGQRQRIAVATVLAMGPEVIIVDEPTTGQDPRQSREMMDLMQSINKESGKTIVVITHDMNLAAEYSDRLVVMHRGKKVLEGTPHEVFVQKEKLATTNLEPPQITMLFQELGIQPLPITVDEGYKIITELMEG